jgi:osmotically-inducible protein OsmY
MRTKRILAAVTIFFCLFAVRGFSAIPGEPVEDGKINDIVSDVLLRDPAVRRFSIDIETTDGIVVLKGDTNNILAKERATRLARTVKGVRGVVNNIRVEPFERDDADILADVFDALRADPATDSWQLDVRVEDGEVALSGKTESWQEKQLAETVAKGVRGVKRVQNDISVNKKKKRTDEEIEKDIRSALRWDRYVDHVLIDTDSEAGRVTLSGSVGSSAEKARVMAIARVSGVKDVDASELDVRSWARDEEFRKGKYEPIEDERVRDAIQDALFYDPRVANFKVNARVDNGVAVLEGEVDNLKAKRSAAKTARNVVGVWLVKNRLRVVPRTPDDATVEKRVEKALGNHPFLESYEIGVEVKNGVAILTGMVDSNYEKATADDVASRVYGVIRVNNNLMLSDPFVTLHYNPYVDDAWYIYDYPWYVYPDYITTREDREIESSIKSELFWSPFVNEEDVSVEVTAGTAVLEGTVETYAESRAAREQAFEGGAVSVVNNLEVERRPQ